MSCGLRRIAQTFLKYSSAEFHIKNRYFSKAFPANQTEWNQKAIDAFKNLVLNKELHLETIRSDLEWPTHFCSLYQNNEVCSCPNFPRTIYSSFLNFLKCIVEALANQKLLKKVSKEVIKKQFKAVLDKEKCLIKVEFDLNETQMVPMPCSPTLNDLTRTYMDDTKAQNFSFENPNEPQLKETSNSLKIEPRIIRSSTKSCNYECTVVHIESPGEFYLCMGNEKFHRYDEMENDLNRYYNQFKNQHRFIYKDEMVFDGSMLCVVKSKTVGKFCRATINSKKMHARSELYFNVQLVDFGHYEDVRHDSVFTFASEFCYLPTFVLRCSLDYIQFCPSPNADKPRSSIQAPWSKSSTDFFVKKLVEFKHFCFSLMNESEEIRR
jgi:hypothetical protein